MMSNSTTIMLNVMTPSASKVEQLDFIDEQNEMEVNINIEPTENKKHEQSSDLSLSMADVLTQCLNPGKKREHSLK